MKNKSKLEKNKLLINVPTYQHGLSALANGVSAISVHGPKLAMASYGSNLSWTEIEDLVSRAEKNDQEVWLRLNSPLHNDDLDIVAVMLEEAVKLGVKRVIYSDPAILYQVQERGHDIGLVLATDTTVTNNAMIEFWAADGVGAFVLSREFNLEQMSVFTQIRNNSNPKIAQSQLILQVHGPIVIMHSLRPILTNLDKFMAQEGLLVDGCGQELDGQEATCEEIDCEKILSEEVITKKRILVEEMRPEDSHYSMEDERGFYVFAAHDLGLYPYLGEISDLEFDFLQINLHPDQSLEGIVTIIETYREGLNKIKEGLDFVPALNWQRELESASQRHIKNLFIESGAPK